MFNGSCVWISIRQYRSSLVRPFSSRCSTIVTVIDIHASIASSLIRGPSQIQHGTCVINVLIENRCYS